MRLRAIAHLSSLFSANTWISTCSIEGYYWTTKFLRLFHQTQGFSIAFWMRLAKVSTEVVLKILSFFESPTTVTAWSPANQFHRSHRHLEIWSPCNSIKLSKFHDIIESSQTSLVTSFNNLCYSCHYFPPWKVNKSAIVERISSRWTIIHKAMLLQIQPLEIIRQLFPYGRLDHSFDLKSQ